MPQPESPVIRTADRKIREVPNPSRRILGPVSWRKVGGQWRAYKPHTSAFSTSNRRIGPPEEG